MKRLSNLSIARLIGLGGVGLAALCVEYVLAFDPKGESALTPILFVVVIVAFLITCFGITLGWAAILDSVRGRKPNSGDAEK